MGNEPWRADDGYPKVHCIPKCRIKLVLVAEHHKGLQSIPKSEFQMGDKCFSPLSKQDHLH